MAILQKMKKGVLEFLNLTNFAFKEGKVDLTEKQVVSLKETFGAENIDALIVALEKEASQSEEIGKRDVQISAIEAENSALKSEIDKQRKAIQTLSAKVEDDVVAEKIDNLGGKVILMGANGDFLFGDAKAWNKISDERPWNVRAAAAMAGRPYIGAVDYTETDVTQMITDLGAYSRADMGKLITYNRDNRRLPSFWETVSGVDIANDEGIIDQMFTNEITQARKKGFLPKGKFKFEPEKFKMYPAQIDLKFIGYELQKLEQTWMFKYIKASGSQPDKMPFIQFLIGETLIKAAKEDEIGTINGVYLPTADDATTPGKAIHKMRGVRKLLREAIIARKLCTFNLGAPTAANILTYVDNLVMTIPEEWRDQPDLVFYLSSSWKDKYMKAYETLKGTYPTFKPGIDYQTVDRHDNVRLEVLPFLNNSDLMFVTPAMNIMLLEMIPGEGRLLSLQKVIRDIVGTADYKKSVHFYSFGRIKAADEVDYVDQMVWLNDVDDLTEIFVDVDPDETTPDFTYHNCLKTGVNTVATAITDLLNVTVGTYVHIRGNSGANPSTIANSGKFVLDSAITLSENVEICLYIASASKYLEYSRTDTAGLDIVVLAADSTTADAADGTHFVTSENTIATALTNIENAVAGTIYTLEGGSSTNATTITSSGYFRLTAAMTLTAAAYLKVRYNGSIFVETERG